MSRGSLSTDSAILRTLLGRAEIWAARNFVFAQMGTLLGHTANAVNTGNQYLAIAVSAILPNLAWYEITVGDAHP